MRLQRSLQIVQHGMTSPGYSQMRDDRIELSTVGLTAGKMPDQTFHQVYEQLGLLGSQIQSIEKSTGRIESVGKRPVLGSNLAHSADDSGVNLAGRDEWIKHGDMRSQPQTS